MDEVRRRVLAGLAAAGIGLTLPLAPVLARGRQLTASTPPGLPGIVLSRLLNDNRVAEQLAGHDLRTWRDPDQFRTWFADGQVGLSASPSNVAANLHNRGLPLVLLNIHIWGTLGLLASGAPVSRIEDLVGRHVGVPWRGDMPDLVFRYLLREAGMETGKDLRVTWLSGPFEAVQMFAARRFDAVVLPEPLRSAARFQARQLGMDISELPLGEEWARLTDGPSALPQAGLVCRRDLPEQAPELVSAIQAACDDAVAWMVDNPAAAAAIGAERDRIPARVLETAIGNTRLEFQSATDARPALEDFFGRLSELDAGFIGGGLPSGAFYGG